ncbi:MAG: ABC transporter substrate-binding protein, partial [Candidatus Lambdaproteobacteria bacterium]|nr:ABC transporter substrate-binding protein [Candidatus Lambdaproteobacteria bacterium]
DVKHTFDMVRGASQQRMKLNPRRAWYKNVKEITTSGDNEVTFSLGRPQPGLVMLLASTYSPVYPAHIPAAELRTKAVGTGAFRLTEYVRDQHLRVRKNADYFVKGRPYLDGVDYIIIKSKGTALAVMTSGQVDVFLPTETEQKTYETLKKNPELVFQRRALGTNNQHMIVNSRKPPFNDPRLRKAVNLALDRYAYTRSIQPGYQVGGYMLGPPDGDWGYGADELRSMPGWRDAALDKEDARKLMREMGYSERNPLKFTLSTRTPANYVEPAQWIIGELKQVYFSPELEIVDDGQWYPRLARRDYTISLAAHGYGANDPDVPYYEGFSCGSQRNYVDYCDPEAEKLFELQSRTVDQVERAKIVRQIELKLIGEAVKPSLAFRVDYNATNKRVKDFIPHSGAYSYGRMQEVWLDR